MAAGMVTDLVARGSRWPSCRRESQYKQALFCTEHSSAQESITRCLRRWVVGQDSREDWQSICMRSRVRPQSQQPGVPPPTRQKPGFSFWMHRRLCTQEPQSELRAEARLKVENEGTPSPSPPHAGSQQTRRFLFGETVLPKKKDLEILAFCNLLTNH